MTRITVACLDMAGTTVADEGTVMEAFTAAIAEQDLTVAAFQQAMIDVKSTMGQSKIEVFRRILGDEAMARILADASRRSSRAPEGAPLVEAGSAEGAAAAAAESAAAVAPAP